MLEGKGKSFIERKMPSNERAKNNNFDLINKKSADFTRNKKCIIKAKTKKKADDGFDQGSLIYRTTINNILGQKHEKHTTYQKNLPLVGPEQLKNLKVNLIGVEGVAYHSRNNMAAKTTVKERSPDKSSQPPHRAQAHRNYGSKRSFISFLLSRSFLSRISS